MRSSTALVIALALSILVLSASGTKITCETTEVEGEIICDGVLYSDEVEELLSPKSGQFWLYLFMSFFLVCGGGLMSGLTLGLMSLDLTTLTVMMNVGDPDTRKHAQRILPLIKRHHLLLVTLLLANALCMEALPLFLDRVMPTVAAILVSVTAVVIFGEILPQAVCSRYGLAIGAKLYYLVWFLIGTFFFISYPLSKALDWMFGHDHGTFFKRQELQELVDLHGKIPLTSGNSEPLTNDEVMIIKGALTMSSKKVSDAMTAIDRVFMLNANEIFTAELLYRMQDKGHSRIPVYEGNVHNIVGVVTVKFLLGVDTEAKLHVSELPMRPALFINDTDGLYETLNVFQTGKSHLGVVIKSQATLSEGRTVVGIITLEDILEELIQEEILDETEVPMDSQRMRMTKLRLRPISVTTARARYATPTTPRQGASSSRENVARKPSEGLHPYSHAKPAAKSPLQRVGEYFKSSQPAGADEEEGADLRWDDTEPLVSPQPPV